VSSVATQKLLTAKGRKENAAKNAKKFLATFAAFLDFCGQEP